MKKIVTAFMLALTMALTSVLAAVPAGAAANPFDDVPDGKWFTAAVLYCSERGFMSGISDHEVDPNGVVTRAQMVLVMAKMANADLSKYTDSPFIDVPNGKWFTGGVVWAAKNGITGGTGNGMFSPSAVVSREQLAVFFYSFAGYMKYDVSASTRLGSFTDLSSMSSWAKEGMQWAVAVGLISGIGPGVLAPKNQCTRAQLSVIIMNFDDYYASKCEHEWIAATCTESSRCKLCGATRGEPLGHDSDATCTEDGTCRRCGAKVPALGHESDNVSCLKDGICKRCGATVPALGHDPKPNCYTAVTCRRCGQTFPALNHTHTELVNVVSPTPYSEGYSGDKRCIDCGKIVEYGHSMPRGVAHSYPEVEQEILRLCNEERAKIGVAPLTWNETIYKCADLRAKECEQKFDHVRPDGSSCFSVYEEQIGSTFSFGKLGENLAYYFGFGGPNAEKLVDMWMDSETHRKNILDPDFTEVSIGIYYVNNHVYSAQLFYTPLM